MTTTLRVSLGPRLVGTLTNLAGDDNLFSFDPSYLEDDDRPVLSQAFITTGGSLVRTIPRTHRVAPRFFANLLPDEGSVLRALIARQWSINRTRDFPYLRVLGRDLPGAVVIDGGDPSNDAPALVDAIAAPERPLRFSLAGVQLKFSAGLAGDRLTIPLDGIGGSWIAKLPTNTYPRLPENEFAMMSLARCIGLDVPSIRLMDLDRIDGLPADLPTLRAEEPRTLYAIARFDRRADGSRVHVEDFNQITDQKPDEKYDRRTSSSIARILSVLCPGEDVDAFVRRLVFGICTGNDDMHLKNWAVCYPDTRTARLAPMYDFVCTRAFLPRGELALTVGGERSFERIDAEAIARFADHAQLSQRRTRRIADEVVAAIRDVWPTFREGVSDPTLASVLERHFAAVPIMNDGQRA